MLPLRTVSCLTAIAVLVLPHATAAQQGQVPPDHAKVQALISAPLPELAPVQEFGIEISGPGRLEFHARAQDVHEVFAQIRLWTQTNIILAPDVVAKFSGDLYDVTPERAVDLICQACGLSWEDRGSHLFVQTAAMQTRVFTLHHAPATDLVTLVKPVMSEKGQISATVKSAAGIEPSQTETGGDSFAHDSLLVVTDFQANLAAVESIVRRMDRTPKQVLVEVTILSADLTERTQLGVNLASLAGVDFEEYGATSSDGFSLNQGTFSGDQLDDGLGAFGSNVASDLSTGGAQLGFIRSNIGVFLRALQEVTNVAIQTNTQVITLNKMRGEVLLGRRDGYRTRQVADGGVVTEQIEFLQTGTQLVLRPFILANGLIRMELHPEDSDGGLSTDGLPTEETAEMTTNVIVRDGDTLVIGGLFREKRNSVHNSVPLLGKLPFIGRAFRSNDDSGKREELIILLTPHILDMEEMAQNMALQDKRPNDLYGADREVVQQRYAQVSMTLIQEGRYGCAHVLLEAAGPANGSGIPSAIHRGLIPQNAASAVDSIILEALKRKFGIGR